MSILIDIIVLAVIVICTIIGYKKGLIKVAVGVLGFFIAIIIALVLYTPISNFIINNTNIKTSIKNSISDTVKSYVIKEENNGNENENQQESKVMATYIDGIVEKQKEIVVTGEKELIDTVSDNVATNIIRIAVAISVFLISKIILLFVKVLADFIAKLPIIKQFNKAGGLIYGVLQGILIVYIVFAVISLISPMLKDSSFIENINNSIIGNAMYNNNIILKLLFK